MIHWLLVGTAPAHIATELGTLSGTAVSIAAAMIASSLLAEWRLRRADERERRETARRGEAEAHQLALARAQDRERVRRLVERRLATAYEHTARPHLEHLSTPPAPRR